MDGSVRIIEPDRPRYSAFASEQKIPWVSERRFYLVQRDSRTGKELQRIGPFATEAEAERHLVTMMQGREE